MPTRTAGLMDFLHGLYQFQAVAVLSENICQRLPALIGGENAIICRHDGQHRIITSVVARHPFSRANLMPHINESGIMAMHPFWESVFEEDCPVRAISGVTSRADWEANPLYNEVFAPDGIRDQLNMEILGNPQNFVTVNVLRGRRGFSEEDYLVFRMLRPHFAQAFENAAMAESAGLVHAPSGSCWMIALDMHGRIAMDEDEARNMLSTRFGTAGDFPEPVARWLNAQVRCLNEGWLETRLAPLMHRHRDAIWQFTLFRNFENPGYTLSARLQQDASRSRHLTPRETEIMNWVAQGKTNDEIALILGLSLNTVKTHLKRIFAKTGVENRTAASLAWKPPSTSAAPPA
jgi:DNA-binding CsgD family transcriptional regulator